MCGKICKAKKKAKKAKKEQKRMENKADDAAKEAENAKTSVSIDIPVGLEVETIGDIMRISNKVNALTPKEVWELVPKSFEHRSVRRDNSAKDLRSMLMPALGVYRVSMVAVSIFGLVGLALNFAFQLGSILPINVLGIALMISQIGVLVGTLIMAVSGFLYKMMMKAFFALPIRQIPKFKTVQVDKIADIVETTRRNKKNDFKRSVRGFSVNKIVDKSSINNTKKDNTVISNGDGESTTFDGNLKSPTEFSEDSLSPKINKIDDDGNIIDDDGSGDEDITAEISVDAEGDISIELSSPLAEDEQLSIDFERELSIDELADIIEDIIEKSSDEILNETEKSVGDEIDIEEIPEAKTFPDEDKIQTKLFINDLQDTANRTEMLENIEVMKQNFNSCYDCKRVRNNSSANPQELYGNELAIAMAEKIMKMTKKGNDFADSFFKVLNKEIEKKKKETLKTKEDILAWGYITENLLDKSEDIKKIFLRKIENMQFSAKDIININDEFLDEYRNSLREEMIELYNEEDSIEDFFNKLNDIDVNVNNDIQNDFKESICNSLEIFKLNIPRKINIVFKSDRIRPIDIGITSPEDIDNVEFLRIFDIFIKEMKNKLIEQVNEVVEEEVVPCKTCSPCEDTYNEVVGFIAKETRYVIKAKKMKIEKSPEDIDNILNRKIMGFDVYSFLSEKLKKEEKVLIKVIQDYIKGL